MLRVAECRAPPPALRAESTSISFGHLRSPSVTFGHLQSPRGARCGTSPHPTHVRHSRGAHLGPRAPPPPRGSAPAFRSTTILTVARLPRSTATPPPPPPLPRLGGATTTTKRRRRRTTKRRRRRRHDADRQPALRGASCLVNPRVSAAPAAKPCWYWEGCLSIPDLAGWVGRAEPSPRASRGAAPVTRGGGDSASPGIYHPHRHLDERRPLSRRRDRRR